MVVEAFAIVFYVFPPHGDAVWCLMRRNYLGEEFDGVVGGGVGVVKRRQVEYGKLQYGKCFVCEGAEKCEKSDRDEQIVFCHRKKSEYMYTDDGMWCFNPMQLVDAS